MRARDWQLVLGAIAVAIACVVTAVALLVATFGDDHLQPVLVAGTVDVAVLAVLIATVRA